MDESDGLSDRLQGNEQLQYFDQKRTAFRDDPYRPSYHFVPPGGTLHDPNGACYWNGNYHLFYQFWPPSLNEDRSWDEAMHWGHTVSDDLIHWRDLPIALDPDSGPEKSCYSGQALVEDRRVILMYHGPGAGNCIATSDGPYLVEFEKHPDNPVIPLDSDASYGVFDPCIWSESGVYYSLSGSYVDGERGEDCRNAAFLFQSDDLADWEYVYPLVEDGFFTDPGEDGAVPNFFSLGDKDVLLFFSHSRGPQYYIGDYDAELHTFDIESHGRMNYGPVDHSNLHAPSVLADDDDRHIAFFNVEEGIENWRERPWEGWSQVLSLPRVLDLDERGLRIEPPSELKSLRMNPRTVDNTQIPSNGEIVLDDVGGRSIEILAEITPEDAQEVGLRVLRSPDGTERTTVSYWERVEALGIDTSESTTRKEVLGRTPEMGPLRLADGESLRLRVFVDRSVVEVFANDRQCLTTRVYPERESSASVSLFARRGEARLESMAIWDMRSIWKKEH